MFLREEKLTRIDTRGRVYPQLYTFYECENCGIEYSLTGSKDRKRATGWDRFCDNEECKLARKIFLKQDVRIRTRQTCLEKYGVDHVFKSKECRDKQRATMLELYGGINVFNSPILVEKVKNTMIKKYGADHPQRVDMIKEKTANTNIERYGNSCPMQNVEIHKSIIDGWIEKYGCDNPLGNAEVKAKIDYTENNRKRTETMLKENRLYVSKPELAMYEWLCNVFGVDNVKRQSWITRTSIDFYVKTLDLYVELDGVFHHGLAKKSDHEREIVKKKLVRDKKVNDWFDKNSEKFKLFRLSDVQWNKISKIDDYNELLRQMKTSKQGVNLFDYSVPYYLYDVR